jgi:hypothetical protein
MNKDLIACIGCGALVPDVEGPSWRYPNAGSPGCWAVFGEILAKEFSDYRYGRLHRMTVDTYAVQHPGDPTPQTIQSVNIHLIALCLTLERAYDFNYTTRMMGQIVQRYKGQFNWLEPPDSLGEMTVLEVVKANSGEEHERLVTSWARSAWQAWKPHHQTIFDWIDRFENK